MTAALLALVAALAALVGPPPVGGLAALPSGPRPQVGYVDHGTWRTPDGRTVELPDRHGISSVTPYAGGFLITDTRYFEGSVGLVRVDATGRVTARWSTSGVPAVADDGRVAWSSFVPPETGQRVRALVHVDCSTLPWPDPGVFSLAGFAGRAAVVTNYLATFLVEPDATRTRVPHLGTAYDATHRWVAGDLRRGSGVISVATGELRWRGRGQAHAFSPSGRRVAVARRSGMAVHRARDGRVLWEQSFRGYAARFVWENERQVLAVVAHRDRAAILRFGAEGVERATRVREHRFHRPGLVLTSP